MDRTIYSEREASCVFDDYLGHQGLEAPVLDPAEAVLVDCDDVAPESSKLVETPEDMARLLLATSPQQAASFALAAHERACWADGDDRAEFWLAVIKRLEGTATQNPGPSGQAPIGCEL